MLTTTRKPLSLEDCKASLESQGWAIEQRTLQRSPAIHVLVASRDHVLLMARDRRLALAWRSLLKQAREVEAGKLAGEKWARECASARDLRIVRRELSSSRDQDFQFSSAFVKAAVEVAARLTSPRRRQV
jgi:hypothetical protein